MTSPHGARSTTHRVTLIPGDGTGPELAEATRRVLEAAVGTVGSGFDWDVQEAGIDIMETAGTPLPQGTIDSVRRNGVAIKGPVTTPIGTGFRSVNVALRYELDLYACLRPCKRSSSRSEEHTSELQSHVNLVCRLLLEKKKQTK